MTNPIKNLVSDENFMDFYSTKNFIPSKIFRQDIKNGLTKYRLYGFIVKVKKILKALFLVIFTLSFALPGVFAQENLIYPAPDEKLPFFGQDHKYSVVFRGNGESVVSGRFIIANNSKTPLSEIELITPKGELQNVFAYQVIKEKVCLQYGGAAGKIYPSCLKYEEPNYFEAVGGNSEYLKAETKLDGDNLIIKLPKPILSEKSGSFFLHFRSSGYAQKTTFGAYKYSFETLKASDQIQSLVVGINTDSDLFLKEPKSIVNYKFDQAGIQNLESKPDAQSLKSESIDRFYENIGQGSIYKEASNLSPMESFTVKGTYADSKLKLYAKEFLLGIFGIALIVSILFLVIKAVFKNLGSSKKESKDSKASFIVLGVGVGFASSLLVLVYTTAVVLLGRMLFSYEFAQTSPVLILFLVIVSIPLYLTLIFGPGIFIGLKKGFVWGAVSVFSTIIWMILYLVIAVFVSSMFFRTQLPPPPYQIMGGVPMDASVQAPETGL